ncbi:rnase iii [Pyrenophora seminiperda CCB06]|uniref:Rnase iii n=1 Tax=Pyrenophora seminiperda CCB06 TaxID=1302712 RepID=A0A3M7M645_9PLEO|nr:rnase iii [Pyrenophora seminiperda CCB06]
MTEHPVEAILQYHFSSSELLDEALLAAGAAASSKNIEGDVRGNKRLALLGDSVLQEAVLEPWYNSEESTDEGHNRVENLCRNTKLSQVAQRSGISSYITKNPSQSGPVPQETAASTIEALVGAVYLDSGKDISMVKKALEAIGFFRA